ncbi:hypothetical protein OsI_28918 [Oryza sativa Indica Group]|uniref:Uncharacterized protein n=1 Tax=Oryza sativa subsp. indica TaxID=39946 RepID=B8BA01_ORYSI|nr:hypothetical protein OsI_28918 [Oryza sativa Indica Group]
MGKPPVVPHGEVALCAFVESSCHALTVGSHLSLPLHGGLPPSPHREEATHHSLAMGGLPPCRCEVGQYRIQPLPTAGITHHQLFRIAGHEEEEFTIELHHGGFFCGVGSSRIYLDEKVDWFDHCDTDTWSSLWLDDFIEQLGYDNSKRKVKDIVESINWDDVALSAPTTLPIVASPRRVAMSQKVCDDQVAKGDKIDDEDDSELDPDFIDSDYEADKGDDDVFDNCVDQTENAEASKLVVELPGCDPDDEGLLLPESSDEDDGGIKLKFKNFVADVDMESPIFKVGMLFNDAIEVRQAIKQYSVKNRVAIRFARNTKKRIEAKCSEECPWMLNASEDSRTKCFMIKQYVDGHKCQKEWELNYVTARYLANRYIESFRDNDKMTLKSFAKVVQKDLNVTPSRYKLGRARRLALEAIHGDEIAQYDMLWDYGQELRTSNPVGIDPNECIYPIAMAIVEVESRASWGWFLNTLKEDLLIDNTAPYTIMTDRQKYFVQNTINSSSRVAPGPLPESNFIATNRRAGVEPPMTTATKEGRATIRKRMAEPRKKNAPPNKKSIPNNEAEPKKRKETKKK